MLLAAVGNVEAHAQTLVDVCDYVGALDVVEQTRQVIDGGELSGVVGE